MDKKFIDGLPPELRQIIMDGWNLYLPDLVKAIRKDNIKTYQGFKTKVKPVNLSPEDIQKIREKVYPVNQKFADQLYPSWLLSGILNSLIEYRTQK